MVKKSKKKSTTKKHSSIAWFYPVRGSYLPCSWQGWLCYLAAISYFSVDLSFSIISVNRQRTSVWYELIGYTINLVLLYFILTEVAKKHLK